MKTNCIICKCEVDNWDEAYPEGEVQVHPLGGTVFRTYGNYGSSVFDPMDATYLDIVVCDDCLKNRIERTYEGENKEYQEELEKKKHEFCNKSLEAIEVEAALNSEAIQTANVWKKNSERNQT